MAEAQGYDQDPQSTGLDAPISRRKLLKVLGLVTGFSVTTGLVLEASTGSKTHTPKKPVVKPPSDLIPAPVTPPLPRDTLEQGLQFSAQFEQGMLVGWRNVSVWPGIAIVPSDMPLFSSADMNPLTAIEWPANRQDRHLIAQRPFMVKSTARMNMPSVDPAIDEQVMAFCMPGSNDIVYCPRRSPYSQAILASNYTGPQYNKEGIMLGEAIDLEPAVEDDGVIWRYLETDRVYGYIPNEVVKEIKVCGRAGWADPNQVNTAFFNFSESQGNDFIQLPRGIA